MNVGIYCPFDSSNVSLTTSLLPNAREFNYKLKRDGKGQRKKNNKREVEITLTRIENVLKNWNLINSIRILEWIFFNFCMMECDKRCNI